jgi:hypothetical protein
LPAIAEGQQSGNGSFGATRRDSQTIPQTVPKTNTLPPKYPEYVLIERRRASFKNWPENLNFLHPLDLSECGFFYSSKFIKYILILERIFRSYNYKYIP